MRTRTLLVAAVFLLVSCKAGRVTKRLAELKPQTDAKLAAMVAVHELLAKVPPVVEDTIVYSGPALRVSSLAYDGNTLVMTTGQLAELAGKRTEQKFPEVIWIEPWRSPLSAMKHAGNSSTWSSFDADDVDRVARPILQTEYLVVLRTLAYVEPQLGAGTFVPGSYAGEAHLFALDSKKHLGGFRFSAKSSEKVNVEYGKADRAEKQNEEIASWVKDDLKSQAVTVLAERLTKLSPK